MQTYALRLYWALLDKCVPAQSGLRPEPRPAEERDVIDYFKSLFGTSVPMAQAVHPYLQIAGDAPAVEQKLGPDGRPLPLDVSEQATNVLAAEILAAFPKESRSSALSFARAYIGCLNEQAEVLFTYVVQSFADREDPKQRLLFFQVLENMFCAISEIGAIVVPRGFHHKFAMLSFECLPEKCVPSAARARVLLRSQAHALSLSLSLSLFPRAASSCSTPSAASSR